MFNPETWDTRRQELHRVAPGYNPSSLLTPISAQPASQGFMQPMRADSASSTVAKGGLDLMGDLVSGLEQMESQR